MKCEQACTSNAGYQVIHPDLNFICIVKSFKSNWRDISTQLVVDRQINSQTLLKFDNMMHDALISIHFYENGYINNACKKWHRWLQEQIKSNYLSGRKFINVLRLWCSTNFKFTKKSKTCKSLDNMRWNMSGSSLQYFHYTISNFFSIRTNCINGKCCAYLLEWTILPF